jgi:hypothetical protein
MTATTVSKCSLENPSLCRIHGDKQKIKFQKRAENNLSSAKERLENAGDNMDAFMDARYALEHAELQYYSTLNGEIELRKEIENTAWPNNEVLQEKLKAALEVRAELEKQDEEAYTYTFPASKLDDALHRIDKANKKLERAGIKEKFTIDPEFYFEEGKDGEVFSMVKITLNHPPLSVEGWDFVAAVDEAGDKDNLVTRVLPGQELQGYRPESMVCDHCGRNRFRKATYLLRNETGEYKQVGSSCLESFLGVKPKALWTLEYDLEETSRIDDGTRISGGADSFVPLETTVAIALAVSNNGKEYTSSTNAMNFGTDSTASLVKIELFGAKPTKIDYTPYLEQAKTVIKDTKFEGDNDYVTNMRAIMSGEKLKSKHIGYATSVVSAYRRQVDGEATRAAKPANAVGYLGAKGEKIKDIDATITFVDYWDNDYTGGKDTMIIMRTPDNKEIKWKASGYKEYEAGNKVRISSATIKDQAVYRENEQTIILRTKMEIIPNDENKDNTTE